jgi:hypothetical protein
MKTPPLARLPLLFAALALASLTARAAAPTVKLTPLDDRVRVEIGGQLFTEYIYKGASRPYLYPVNAADGTSLVRDFPMKETPGEDHDHKHHRALMFVHSNVNQIDFWNEGTSGTKFPKGNTINDGIVETKSGDVGVLRVKRGGWPATLTFAAIALNRAPTPTCRRAFLAEIRPARMPLYFTGGRHRRPSWWS